MGRRSGEQEGNRKIKSKYCIFSLIHNQESNQERGESEKEGGEMEGRKVSLCVSVCNIGKQKQDYMREERWSV